MVDLVEELVDSNVVVEVDIQERFINENFIN
jgi:hypothetical protein